MRTSLSLLLVVAACLPAALWADPFAHTWCRLSTPRFEIITDLNPGDVTRLAEQMEVFRVTAEAFIHASGKAADIPLKVVVFRDRDDFRTTMKAPRFSGFMQPSLRESMLIIGPQQANSLLHETALHEYSHYLLRNLIDVSFPVWYDEGLAAFLSTMRVTKRYVYIGNTPPYDVEKVIRSSSLSLRQTVESQHVYAWDQSKLNDFYAMAWGLVHFIQLSHKAGFVDRRSNLDTYLGAVTLPFESSFGLSYEQLGLELRRYTRKNSLPKVKLPRPDVSLPAAEPQCLDPQARDYELATTMISRNPEASLTTFETLHTAHPKDPRYLIGLSTAHAELKNFDEALSFADQALANAPRDASAQIEYATRLVHGCVMFRGAGCAEKWRRAVKLFRSGIRQDPQRFDAVLGLGLSYLHSGRPGDARNYLRIAYQKAPWAPHINFYLGESYRLIGDRRAVVHLTNARNWSTQKIWRSLADAALDELD